MNKCKYCDRDYDPSDADCIECQLIEASKGDKREKAIIKREDMECR
jgi:hypothetical protein